VKPRGDKKDKSLRAGMKLKEYFETSFGSLQARPVILVKVEEKTSKLEKFITPPSFFK